MTLFEKKIVIQHFNLFLNKIRSWIFAIYKFLYLQLHTIVACYKSQLNNIT